jgi:hypothetical protein
MNSVTKSIILTALASSLANSAPAPASAFSRGGGGFHGGGFHAGGFGGGMRGFGGGHMFTGRSVARGGAFAGRGFGVAATVDMAVTATVILPTATKSAPTTIGATQFRAAPTSAAIDA